MIRSGFLYPLVSLAAAVLILTGSEVKAQDAKPTSAKTGPKRFDDHGDPLPDGALARIGTVRLRGLFVRSIAFSPDGRELVFGASCKELNLWDPATGKQVRSFLGHNVHANAIAFSRDGTLLASGSGDAEIILWRTSDGKILHRMKCRHPLTSIAFSPDGMLIVSGEQNNSVRVWDGITGRELQCFQGKGGDVVVFVAFSPDG